MVKSHGAERLGKGYPRDIQGKDKGDELTVTADEVSRTGYILSKSAEYIMQL